MGDIPKQSPQEPVQMEITLPEEKKEEEKQPDDTPPPKLTKIDKILFFGMLGIILIGFIIAIVFLFIENSNI